MAILKIWNLQTDSAASPLEIEAFTDTEYCEEFLDFGDGVSMRDALQSALSENKDLHDEWHLRHVKLSDWQVRAFNDAQAANYRSKRMILKGAVCGELVDA